ncbi:methyltransferase domain-containing protein [Pseudorhizobium flavum]|uniref:O-antigen chain-terminating methyltransferase n=1 Tax=Pseudorhizobium flavum TaxID=1335061 RepID=A0A7X0DEM0_9HYPH|nr:methyltransferase domain-containing protein [Pseudorhizobium flavum]MBB6182072.1 O-antigen chain-terminating methyltransferase [Pseudorhizobium flavum]CAD6632193.1 class I SAM-dependent methyltransferase [Pseudorhizobium flavum]
MDEKTAVRETPETIDEILARVRAELASVAPASGDLEDAAPLRRTQGVGAIPLVVEPDDSEVIPLGRPFYTIEEFAALDEDAFLRNAYRIVLGREMDAAGASYYLPALRGGHIGVVRVLSALRRSAEGREHGVRIRWLIPAAILDRLAGLPVVGKFFAPFMTFLVRSQTNRRLATVAQRHLEMIGSVNTSLSAVRKSNVHLENRITMAERGTAEYREFSLRAHEDAANALSEIKATRQLIAEESLQLRRLINEARAALPERSKVQDTVETLENHKFDSLYVAFENRFRGSTAEISKRSERYLPIFRHAPPVAAGGVVLDIGCGRGEWLSLLKRHNIATRGIDLNVSMVAEARSLGLDVIDGDAIAYLRDLPENSLAAVTGFHIVEHLTFKDLVALFDEARRALMPGGVILFETPNPENLVVGACTFNYDPTHNKPLPPDFLRFIAEVRGYEEARIIRSEADCDLSQPETGFAPDDVNDWFRQPPDYAVYARKPDNHGTE